MIVRFQSTPPRRGRHTRGTQGRTRSSFNPRPREGGDAASCAAAFTSRRFQSTPPRRGRQSTLTGRGRASMFQSTPPRRGRPASRGPRARGSRCFNPRPREGGDARSADTSARPVVFQSTPPRRGRHRQVVEAGDTDPVSIHAPAKGATSSRRRPSATAAFQSTPPRRGRQPVRDRAVAEHQFQSTPPRRGRLASFVAAPYSDPFQSTPPRRGRRQHDIRMNTKAKLSRLREPRGETTRLGSPKVYASPINGFKSDSCYMCEPTGENMRASGSRTLKTPAGHPDRKLPCCPHALSWNANLRRADKIAGCPPAHLSRPSVLRAASPIALGRFDIRTPNIEPAVRNPGTDERSGAAAAVLPHLG